MTDGWWRVRTQRTWEGWRKSWRDTRRRRRNLSLALAGTIFVVGVTVLVSWKALIPGTATALQVGDVVAEDIRAPSSLTYDSELLTAQLRALAGAAVGPVYDPPDPNVSRQQVALLGQILAFMDDVRTDAYATPTQKAADLAQITALSLPEDVIETIVAQDASDWPLMAAETQVVLERVLREPIRDQDLPQVLANVPTQVSVRFSPEQAAVISAIVSDLVRPNSLVNVEATEAARAAEVEAVEPVPNNYERGQVIVRAGERVDTLDAEALAAFGLLDLPNVQAQEIVRGVGVSLLLLVVIALYLRRVQPDVLADLRLLAILEALLLITLFSVRLIAPAGQVVFIPAALIGIVYASLTTPATAVAASFLVGIAGAMIMDNGLEYAVYVSLGSAVGALLTRTTDRVPRTFFAGLMIGLTNVVVLIIFRSELVVEGRAGELGVLLGAALLMGVTTAIAALAILYLLTLVLNLPTSLKLSELSQPNHPLLQRLLREAPGTYQHSLQVANFSEQAANAVGANNELVRVSALYHDVGKVMNPMFFVENQADGVNPHDALNDPYRSASIIISHVPDGDRLARQHRLPPRVRDFVWQHHGTTRVSYFYNRAIEQAGDPEAVDSAAFTYPGPRPQTREASIMMLADSSESTVRARKPSSRQEIAEIVQQIIDARTIEGQLDESDLTLKDLRAIHRVFVEVLQGVFHPRINYPALATRRATSETPAVKPTAPVPAPIVPPAEEDTPLPEVPRLRNHRAGLEAAHLETADTSDWSSLLPYEVKMNSATPVVDVLNDADWPVEEAQLVKAVETTLSPVRAG